MKLSNTLLLFGAATFCWLAFVKSASVPDTTLQWTAARDSIRTRETKTYVENKCLMDCNRRHTIFYEGNRCICKTGYYRRRKSALDPNIAYCLECSPCQNHLGNPYLGRACDCGNNNVCCPEENMDVVMKDDGLFQCRPKMPPSPVVTPNPKPGKGTTLNPEPQDKIEKLLSTIKNEISSLKNEVSDMKKETSVMKNEISAMKIELSDMKEIYNSIIVFAGIALVVILLLFFILALTMTASNCNNNG